MVHRGSRCIALTSNDHGTRRGEGSASRPVRSVHSERPGNHCTCTGRWLGPRAGLDRCGKSRLHRDSIPDRPARSQSLYRLRYPARCFRDTKREIQELGICGFLM